MKHPKKALGLPKANQYGGFLKWWYPQIIHFHRVFHYKPSILGYPFFLETPIFIQRPGNLIFQKLPGLSTFGGVESVVFFNLRFFVQQNSDTFPWQKSLSRSLESLGPLTVHVILEGLMSCSEGFWLAFCMFFYQSFPM